jgi:hypothetical protein
MDYGVVYLVVGVMGRIANLGLIVFTNHPIHFHNWEAGIAPRNHI